MFSRKNKKNSQNKSVDFDLSKYHFHVMPEQFLSSYGNKKNLSKKVAKTGQGIISSSGGGDGGPEKTKIIGLLIIVGGVIAVIGGVILVYWLSFRNPAIERQQSALVNVSQREAVPQEEQIQENIEPQQKAEEETPHKEPLPKESTDQKPAEEPSEKPKESDLITVEVFKEAPDQDDDGFSDQEEVLFGTNQSSADTDQDGYPDADEVLNLYSPIGPERLADTLLVKKITLFENFQILYPYSWILDQNDDLIIIRATTGEFFQILKEENQEMLPVEEWFTRQNPTGDALAMTSKTFGKWSAVFSHDGLTAYLSHPMAPDTIIVIFYNPVDQDTLYYKTTFEMMLRSLSYVGFN